MELEIEMIELLQPSETDRGGENAYIYRWGRQREGGTECERDLKTRMEQQYTADDFGSDRQRGKDWSNDFIYPMDIMTRR